VPMQTVMPQSIPVTGSWTKELPKPFRKERQAELKVGETLDLLEIRLKRCQLGLFGFAGKKLIVEPAAEVSPELEKAIRGSLADRRLSCLSAWKIADEMGIARMDVTSACEALKIKIKPCQLGAF
jgi:hypothetical protein